MNCEICKKTFTGIECFKQHEASEKHKKKLLLHQSSISSESVGANAFASTSKIENINPNTIHCKTCSRTFQTIAEFTEHSGSQEHALLVLQKMNTQAPSPENSEHNSTVEDMESTSREKSETAFLLNSSLAMASWQPRCEKCDKNFSGPEPYRAHIASFAHKKKCGLIPTSGILAELPPLTNSSLYCKLCDVSLSGPAPYEDHMRSMRHKKKELASSMIRSKNSDENSGKENSAVDGHSNMELSVEIPAKLPPSNCGPLYCKICDVSLSGPVPYGDHMRSMRHKKKEWASSMDMSKNSNDYSGMENSAVDGHSDKELNVHTASLAWFCEVCNIRCSGIDPYLAHLKSKGHAKKAVREDADSKIKELRSLLSSQTSSFESFGQASEQVAVRTEIDGIRRSGNAPRQDLGHEVKKSLYGDEWDSKTCTPSDLDLTFFAVGEEIDFDKNSKCKIEVSDLDMIEVKEEENEEMDE